MTRRRQPADDGTPAPPPAVGTVNLQQFTELPDLVRARRRLAAAGNAAQDARLRLALLERDQADHEAERVRIAERGRSLPAGADLEPVPIDVAYAQGHAGPWGLVQYHAPVDPEALTAARADVDAAEAAEAEARAAVEALLDGPAWDLAAEAARVGARYVAARDLTLGGSTFVRGEPVPPAALAAVPWRTRRALLDAHHLQELI